MKETKEEKNQGSWCFRGGGVERHKLKKYRGRERGGGGGREMKIESSVQCVK